jgi:hypothetical protein
MWQGKKWEKKTKTNKQEKAEKKSGERDDDLLSIDMSIDMAITSIFEQISLRFIFNSPHFFTAPRKRFFGATTTTTTTTCSLPKNLFRLFLFRPDYDRIEEAFFHIVPQCEHSISLDKQTTLDI